MKVYIHTDLDGISGIGCPEMILKGDERYGFYIRRLMADVDAAVDGVLKAGPPI